MGCGSSIDDTVYRPDYNSDELYAQNFKVVQINKGPQGPPKRQDFMKNPKLNQNEYNKVWGYLRHDRVDALVIFMEQEKKLMDPYYEISTWTSNEYWNFAHFCCKHNAARCLQWILTDAYFEKPEQYASLVNARTSDDQTPLGIAIVQGSTQSFNLLFRFGGLNLNKKNKNQSYIQLASKNKRNQFWQKLKKLQKLDIIYLKVHEEQFDIQRLSKALQQSKEQANQRIKQQNQKLKIEQIAQNNKQTNDQYQTNIVNLNKELQKYNIAIQQLQKDMEKEKQEQFNNIKKQQQQRLKQLQLKKKDMEHQQYARKKAQQEALSKKRQQERRLQVQMEHKKKQQQLRQKKLQEQIRIKQEKKKKAQLLAEEQKQRLIEKAKVQAQLKAQLIRKQKELINQNKQEIAKKVTQQNGNIQKQKAKAQKKYQEKVKQIETGAIKTRTYGNLQVLPQGIKNKYKTINGSFKDLQFPPQQSTLGKDIPAKMKNASWLRPKQIFQTDQFKLFDGIDPNDITQGSLGVCYYLSTISCLAQRPERIQKLFAFADIDKGFYVLKFYTVGKQDYIVVDDYIPCDKMSKSPLFTTPKGKQAWVMILEKAWVKQFGSYISAEAMSPDMMMENVTGAPSQGIWVNKRTKEDIFNTMLQYDRDDSIIVLTSASDKKIQGIVACHAYSLISVHDFNGHKLYKIRNPWGKFEWQGQYGDKSPKWAADLKKQVGFTQSANDGIFFMSINQLAIAFSYISVGMIKKKYVNTAQSITNQGAASGEASFEVFYQAKISKSELINIRVCQPFKRFAPALNKAWKDYDYSPFIFQIFHVQSKQLLAQGQNNSNFGAKSVNCNQRGFIQAKPGTILVRIKPFLKISPPPVWNLCCYSESKIQFTKIADKNKALLSWQSCMANLMQKMPTNGIGNKSGYNLKWLKGQLLLYVTTQPNSAVKIIFNANSLKNCVPGYRVDPNNKLVTILKNGQIGTVDKLVIKDACSTGSFNIQVVENV